MDACSALGRAGAAWCIGLRAVRRRDCRGPEMSMQSAKTQPFAPEPSSSDDLLETGLPNLWYLIARSEDIDVRPVALKRLDRNIVLWRGEKGEINVVEEYCPHRGAPLSMGEVINRNVACAYHGVQVTGEGILADVPPTPNCPLVGQKAIKSYPCRELAGAIWAYFGDEAHAQAPEPIFPEEITSNEWTGFLITKTWQCNWQVALDNRADPVHGRSEEHTSELQSLRHLVCRLLLE